MYSLSPRPQLVSFVLLAIVVSAWIGTAQDLQPRWWLIPLTWLWACSHGMWLLGPLVGAVVVTGLVIDRRVDLAHVTKLALVPVGGVVAASLTPAGPSVVWAFFETRGDQQFITEWAAPSLSNHSFLITLAMIAAVVVTWARRTEPVAWHQVLLLAVAAGWTLMAVRTVAVGAIIVAPIFAAAVQAWLRREPSPVTSHERGLVAAVTVVILGFVALGLPGNPAVAGDKFPERLSPALQQLPEGTVIYNEYFLGGWLTWEHRDLAPVIDGMTHAYSSEWVARYASARGLNDGWYAFVESTDAGYAVLQTRDPMAIALGDHYDWNVVAEDETAGYVLLEAPDA